MSNPSIPAVSARTCRHIAVFNQKGGVGKTTTVVSLACELASKGYKVAAFGADPQCNLAGFLLEPGVSQMKWTGDGKAPVKPPVDGNVLEEFFKQPTEEELNSSISPAALNADYPHLKKTLVAALSPKYDVYMAKAMGMGTHLKGATMVDVSQRDRLFMEQNPGWTWADNSLKLDFKSGGKLFVLPGGLKLEALAEKVTTIVTNSEQLKNFPSYLAACQQLMDKTAKKEDLDFILVDLSPSANPWNRLWVMSCDSFLLPCSSDVFSWMAVKNMAKLLPEWLTWMNGRRSDLGHHTSLRAQAPVFMGYSIQKYSDSGPDPWMEKIHAAVKDTLLPALQPVGMAFRLNKYGRDVYALRLLAIPHLQGMQSVASECHVPISKLKGVKTVEFEENGKSDVVINRALVELADREYTRLADRVVAHHTGGVLTKEEEVYQRGLQEDVFYMQTHGSGHLLTADTARTRRFAARDRAIALRHGHPGTGFPAPGPIAQPTTWNDYPAQSSSSSCLQQVGGKRKREADDETGPSASADDADQFKSTKARVV